MMDLEAIMIHSRRAFSLFLKEVEFTEEEEVEHNVLKLKKQRKFKQITRKMSRIGGKKEMELLIKELIIR